MCGVAGFVQRGGGDSLQLQSVVAAMAEKLAHRGPDDCGTWVDADAGVAFGHRRLSILDLSREGHQPMSSACQRYVMAFNGEVYNFAELRRELESKGHRFRGHSDTEVMLTAITEWGLEAAVKNFAGMFAFALWDRQERALHLVRDRIGIKPMYYGWAEKTFLFGSELKALRVHPDFLPEVDRQSLALQLRFSYVPLPFSIYRGIFKLPPGSILTLPSGAPPTQGSEGLSAYWSAREVAERGAENPFKESETEAVEELDALLRDAVRLHRVADVPLGAFLSGGVDSSTVVALMQAQSTRPVKTFTIGFHEDRFNEANYAKKVATHLGTEHTELYVTPQEAMAVIPKLPVLYDEPFADASQIPTYLVSSLAKQQVKVSLSGDGGDELFGGYTHYLLGPAIWKRIGWLPSVGRRALGRLIQAVKPETYSRWMRWLERWTGRYGEPGPVGDKFHKLAGALTCAGPDELYLWLTSHWKDSGRVVLGLTGSGAPLTDHGRPARLGEFSERMMLLDLVTYLPDDILTKVDRASMSVSLEARVPLLDHRVVEFSARLPLSLKIREGCGKWVLRNVLRRYVPADLIERPKMGFGVPIGDWLRGPLKDWAEDLLNENRLKREGFLRSEPIRKVWAEHLSGQRNWQYYLWDVLMFETWLAENSGVKRAPERLAPRL